MRTRTGLPAPSGAAPRSRARKNIVAWAVGLALIPAAMFPATVSAGDEHAEPEGLILRQGGEVIVTVWEGLASGEIEVIHDETTSDISVSFLDADSLEFLPEVSEGFSLYVELADPSAVSYAQTGDWTFTLSGILEGITGVRVGVFHDGHVDWLSPEIEIHVEEEHSEAEGLVLRLAGVEQVRVFEGTVEGELYIGNGATSSYDVVFLDADGEEFLPEAAEGFSLWGEVSDPGTATYVQSGDWEFTLEGLVDGLTELSLGISHEGHFDYVSPGVPVTVLGPASVDPVATVSGVALRSPQPNPIRGTATLRFHLPEAGSVDLGVFDAAGRLVERLLSEARGEGGHAVEWNSSGLAGGIYYARLTTAGGTSTVRVVVTR